MDSLYAPARCTRLTGALQASQRAASAVGVSQITREGLQGSVYISKALQERVYISMYGFLQAYACSLLLVSLALVLPILYPLTAKHVLVAML